MALTRREIASQMKKLDMKEKEKVEPQASIINVTDFETESSNLSTIDVTMVTLQKRQLLKN